MMNRKTFLNIDQAENDGAGGGAGGAAVGEQPAGAGAEGAAGEGAAGQAGNGEQPSAEEPQEFDLGGQKVKYTKAQMMAELSKALDYTKKTQGVAALRKEYAAKIMRADEILKEMQARGEKPGEKGQEQPEPGKEDLLRSEVEQLKQDRLVEKWERFYSPVKTKFPDVKEADLIDAFTEAVRAGDVDDNQEGLNKVAEDLNKGIETTMGSRLDKLLANESDPRIAALKKKAVQEYLDGKLKLQGAGGDGGKGGGPGGSGGDGKESIGDVAERYRRSLM